MNKELIQKLKDPAQAQPFWMLSKYHPEAAKIIAEAKPEQLLYVTGRNSDWRTPKGQRCPDYIYILKPDYQPRDEHFDVDIIRGQTPDSFLGIWNNNPNTNRHLVRSSKHDDFITLGDILSIPTFVNFFYKVKAGGMEICPYVHMIAPEIHRGEEIVARFLKE